MHSYLPSHVSKKTPASLVKNPSLIERESTYTNRSEDSLSVDPQEAFSLGPEASSSLRPGKSFADVAVLSSSTAVFVFSIVLQ